jgi:hypothetical protein
VSIARNVVLLCLLLLAVSASPALADGSVQVGITGAGAVAAETGIDCHRAIGGQTTVGVCSAGYEDVEQCAGPVYRPICLWVPPVVTFSAQPARGYSFDGWTGQCAGQSAHCTLTIKGGYKTTAVFKDTEDPSIKFKGPASVVRGEVVLSAEAGDNTGVARVDFKLGGVTVSDSAAPYSASFDTRKLGDGATQAVATAVDVTGRSAALSVATTVDNTVPTVTVGGPNGAVFGPGATPAWTIAAGDTASGVKSVQCSLVAAGAGSDFKPCGASFTAPVKPHGAYALVVRVTDNANNVTDVGRGYSIDAIAPVTTIGAGAADSAVVSDPSLTWEFSAAEAASFACRVYPAALTPGAFAPCSSAASHTAAGFSPGVYTFEVRATDAVGNVETSSVKRTFTVVPPPPAPVVENPVPESTPAPLPGPAGEGHANPAGLNAAGKSAPQIRVNLTFTFSNSTKKQTKLTSLVLKGVPAGATVSAKGFKKTNAAGTVSLKKLLSKPFKAGTLISIKVSKPGMGTAIKTLKILPRKTPVVSTKCQAPGATRAVAC